MRYLKAVFFGGAVASIALFCLFCIAVAASAPAQVTITGGTIVTGAGGGSGPCTDCALVDAANVFTLTNSFPALNVTNGVNGLDLYENTGLFNIGIGVTSTPSTASGSQNLGIGDGTNQNLTSGYDNTAIGVAANGDVTVGGENTAIGTFAVQSNVNGIGNTGIGSLALANATQSYNVGIGNLAMGDLVTGSNNVAIGSFSGCGTLCNSSSGPIDTVSNSIYIGFQAGASTDGVTNQVLIGYNIQSSTSNYMQLGNSAITAATIYGVPTFPGLAGSGAGCVGVDNTGLFSVTTCGSGGGGPTFQVNGTGLISATTVNFLNSAATHGLTLTFTNPSTGNVQLGFTGTLTNAGLATPSTTVNSQTCTLGSTCTIPFQTNTTGNTSQAGINLTTSTANAVGLTVTPVNSATNVEKFEITGASYTGNAATATALAVAPTLCSTGNAPTGILANGNATGCAAIGGGGGGGPTIQVNTVNTSNQTLLNFVSTASVLFTNPSGGVVSATVPTSTSSVLGISSPDNTTIGATAGAYHIISPGATTILGFNSSNAYTGYAAGTGISLASGLITNTGITGSMGTTNCIPKASSSTALTCSLATDSGTVFSIADSGGLQVTGSFPGTVELATGSGTLPALPANSYGEVGPLTGGTSYLFQHPNTAVAGVELWAAPASLYGVNITQSKFFSPEWNLAANTFAPGIYAVGAVIASAVAVNAGHFKSLNAFYEGGGCTGPPVINVYDTTASTSGTALTANNTGQASQAQTLAYAAGDLLQIKIVTQGTGCSSGNHAVSAQLASP